MMRHPLKVMIVGAGTGGLCLAHGLKSDGVAVEVFERDYTPSDRQQGYRLSLSATGSTALKTCLPDALFEKLVESSANPSQGITFLDHRLKRLLAIDFPRSDRKAVNSELPVSRITLRRILLEGLDDVVHFGKKFVSFEDAPNGAVTACFEDGSTATGDVLIGADGASSHLRAQLLPHAQRVETGIVAISGKFGLNDDTRAITPQPIFRGPTLILGPRGCFMFGSALDYGEVSDTGTTCSTAYNPPSYDREEYVMWGFSAHRETFTLPSNFEALDGEALKDAVIALVDDWHPDLVRLVRRAEVSTVTAFPVKTSVPIPPWKTRNVTLLGDALHNMTPYRGIGANTALWDAAALRQALVAVDRGEENLIHALASYEREMVDYGFRAVRTSLKDMERFHSQSVPARTLTKSIFRTIDLFPPLKGVFLDGR
ncbi:MAG: FAD-dependent monooxygenase [Chloroflexi bacterium]|nr:FAD-dependent monooxygenase [Chloroflexota bacterium]